MEKKNLLDISTLTTGIPVIIDEMSDFLRVNCIICFSHNGHKSGVNLTCDYDRKIHSFDVLWEGERTLAMSRALGNDTRKAVDWAAVAISLLLLRELTEYTAFEQSSIGTTIDYYLCKKEAVDDLIFNHSARIEVSGILSESKENTITKRVNEKKRRLKSAEEQRTFISVVEFSQPHSIMEAV